MNNPTEYDDNINVHDGIELVDADDENISHDNISNIQKSMKKFRMERLPVIRDDIEYLIDNTDFSSLRSFRKINRFFKEIENEFSHFYDELDATATDMINEGVERDYRILGLKSAISRLWTGFISEYLVVVIVKTINKELITRNRIIRLHKSLFTRAPDNNILVKYCVSGRKSFEADRLLNELHRKTHPEEYSETENKNGKKNKKESKGYRRKNVQDIIVDTNGNSVRFDVESEKYNRKMDTFFVEIAGENRVELARRIYKKYAPKKTKRK